MPRKKQLPSAPIPGLIHTSFAIPEDLAEGLRILRRARSQIEREDVKLGRLYREAIEQYLNARPQRQLIEAYQARMAASDSELETAGAA